MEKKDIDDFNIINLQFIDNLLSDIDYNNHVNLTKSTKNIMIIKRIPDEKITCCKNEFS